MGVYASRNSIWILVHRMSSILVTLGFLLTFLTLFPLSQVGDLILTGTPSGVGQVKPGDKVDCKLHDNGTGVELAKIKFEAVEREGRYQFKG
jgi:acylpyruvate hydrolase